MIGTEGIEPAPGPGDEPTPDSAALTDRGLLDAVAILAARDPDLAGVVDRFGPPPMWAREPGFPTLLHILLEQQVSLASAQAAFDRLRVVADPLTPARFLELDDRELLAIGFSRQKTRYARELARAIVAGRLDLEGLAGLDDEAVHRSLVALTGIGPWTASVYLLMVLRRPDVWPASDIALATAVAAVKGLADRPGPAAMTAIAEAWRPWRSVAARLFWHDYLSRRGRS
jgi:DNA-3-methyladenine glycosylase II